MQPLLASPEFANRWLCPDRQIRASTGGTETRSEGITRNHCLPAPSSPIVDRARIGRKLSPVHNLRSVECYAQNYKNVLKLLQIGLGPKEICGILSLSHRLVNQHVDITKEHHPETLTHNSRLQKQMAGSGPVPA